MLKSISSFILSTIFSIIFSIIFLLVIAASAVLSPRASAHGHDQGPAGSFEATLALYSKAISFTPEEMTEHSVSTPSVRISGQTIYLNGPFWQLTRGWLRVYYRALQEECDRCIEWDEEMFLKSAEDQIAQSFLSVKLQQPFMEGLEHIAVGSADVGARLGEFALTLKVSAEVGETALSKASFLGGWHFLCHLIDAYILFGTRSFQSYTRAFFWAGKFDASRVANVVKFGFVSSVVRKAQKRVRFILEPVSINEEQLHEVDLEGPNRWWGWAGNGKRSAWITKIVDRANRGKFENSLSQREFLGGRMKRYIFLKGRKRGHSTFMRGHTPLDKSLNRSLLWVLQVQESLLQRSLISQVADAEMLSVAQQSLVASASAPEDEIRNGLAREFSEARGGTPSAESVSELLREVEVVFNPNLPMKVRYFQAAALENFTGAFMYSAFSDVLNERGEVHGNSFAGISRQFRLRWRTGKFGRYIYSWSDYLKIAALQNDPDVLAARKYEAMEAMLKIFDYFTATEPLITALKVDELNAVETLLAGQYRTLQTFTPWSPKRENHSLLGRVGRCEDMIQAVGE